MNENSKVVETDAEKSVFRFVDPRKRSEEFSAAVRSVVKLGANVVVETADKARAKANTFVDGAEQGAAATVSGVASVGRHVFEASARKGRPPRSGYGSFGGGDIYKRVNLLRAEERSIAERGDAGLARIIAGHWVNAGRAVCGSPIRVIAGR